MLVREVLSWPLVAIAIGGLVGVGLLLPVLLGQRFVAGDAIDIGLAIVMGSVFVGLLLALGALFLYRAVAPEGVVWFGPALVGGFIAALGVFALRTARQMLHDTTRR